LTVKRGVGYLIVKRGVGYLIVKRGVGYLIVKRGVGYLIVKRGVRYLIVKRGVGYLIVKRGVGYLIDSQEIQIKKCHFINYVINWHKDLTSLSFNRDCPANTFSAIFTTRLTLCQLIT
jgi:hypothetical protein